MAVAGISDSVTAALHLAINGLDTRQRTITSNIANVETPNYLAKEVKFEDSLKAALSGGGDPMSASISLKQRRKNLFCPRCWHEQIPNFNEIC